MHDAETRALWRAALLLFLVSSARWIWVHRDTQGAAAESSVLAELTEATERAVDDQMARSTPLGPDERIDPNTATEPDLDRLPGVGPATARAIVAARRGGAVFRRPDDLESVRGIGPALVERIRSDLEFGPTPRRGVRGRSSSVDVVNINRAGIDELQTLPGVGPAIAARIIERRRTRRFESLDDLLDVRGIGAVTLERLRARAAVAGGG